MHIKKLLPFLIIFLLTSSLVSARTSTTEEKVCPLCGAKFECIVDMSGTLFARRLDMKPLGPIPAPWRIPVCPQCHYVFGDDISEEELAKCKNIVKTEKYIGASGRATYYLLGLLYEGLQKDHLTVAGTFLQASWEEEENPENLKEDMCLTLKYIDLLFNNKIAALSKDAKTADIQFSMQFLKGELLRRLGRFEEAKAFFADLQKNGYFQNKYANRMLHYELDLCAQKDPKPHAMIELDNPQ